MKTGLLIIIGLVLSSCAGQEVRLGMNYGIVSVDLTVKAGAADLDKAAEKLKELTE